MFIKLLQGDSRVACVGSFVDVFLCKHDTPLGSSIYWVLGLHA